jgi:dihydroflavonol-4-reductase
MKTLVTGASGLVGNNVVRLLVERGETVRALVREGSDPRPLLNLPVDIRRGDVCDGEAVLRAAEGVDRVVHAAAEVRMGYLGMKQAERVNVGGTRRVLEAVGRVGARLIHVSSADTLSMGTPDRPADEDTPSQPAVACPYILTKRAAEEAVFEAARAGLDVVVVNPTYMLGPWDWKPSSGRMLLNVGRGRGWWSPPGGNDFSDVRDVAAGVLLAAEKGERGRRYLLGGVAMSYLEAWRLIARTAGVRGPIGAAHRKMPLVWLTGGLGSLWGRMTGREPVINLAAVRMAGLSRWVSSDRARGELGYRTRPVEETVRDAWEWFRSYGYV